MKLEQCEKVGRGTRTRYIASVQDITGAEDYQLVVAGPDVLIKRILKDTDFSIKINPNATKDDWEATQKSLLDENQTALSSLVSLENVKSFFKRQPSIPRIDNSIFIALHRIRGRGTLYSFELPYFSVGFRQNLYFSLAGTVNFCSGYVKPVIGDADLYLSSNDPFGSSIASSVRAGTTLDAIFYGPAWFFVPWFRIFGYAVDSTGTSTGKGGFAGWTALF
jgi:hypothetical protein